MKILTSPIQHLQRLYSHIGNRLLPSQCLCCGSTLYGELLCDGCSLDLPWATRYGNLCVQCGLACWSEYTYCGHCLQQPAHFSHSHIPFAYDYPLNSLIHQFKYRRSLTSGKLLGHLLCDHIQDARLNSGHWLEPDILIPIPLHWSKRWQRGFNQSEILAHYLAHALTIPMQSKLVQRHVRAAVQKELTRAERQKNLRHVFYISPKASTKIAGKNIAVIDDVMTTTATMRELSRLLIAAGANDVQVWALARTMEK
jgi:ComF family protein